MRPCRIEVTVELDGIIVTRSLRVDGADVEAVCRSRYPVGAPRAIVRDAEELARAIALDLHAGLSRRE